MQKIVLLTVLATLNTIKCDISRDPYESEILSQKNDRHGAQMPAYVKDMMEKLQKRYRFSNQRCFPTTIFLWIYQSCLTPSPPFYFFDSLEITKMLSKMEDFLYKNHTVQVCNTLLCQIWMYCLIGGLTSLTSNVLKMMGYDDRMLGKMAINMVMYMGEMMANTILNTDTNNIDTEIPEYRAFSDSGDIFSIIRVNSEL